MNIEEIYVVKSKNKYEKLEYKPDGLLTNQYTIVSKKHEHILDAWLDGCNIFVYTNKETGNKALYPLPYPNGNGFIETYNNKHDYEAVPKSLDNCYCDCTKSHKQKIEGITTFRYNMSTAYYENGFRDKKIQYNTQLENWVYCPYDDDDDDNINYTKKEIRGESKEKCPSEETCSYKIEFNNTKREEMENKEINNNFNDYGFKADFEGEILKETKDYYIGYYEKYRGYGEVDKKYNEYKIYPCKWDKEGLCVTLLECTSNYDTCGDLDENYNLKPIKKEWYEDENQSRVVMFLNKEGNDDHLNILFSEEFVKKPKLKDFENKPYGWRLATNKEIDTLKINHN